MAPPDAPRAGDYVWLSFSPQSGHEQAGRRPALVLSPHSYNQRSGLMLCCPLTTRVKGYPFEVSADEIPGVRGLVLSDQVRSLDWQARRAERIGRAKRTTLEEVLAKISPLLSF